MLAILHIVLNKDASNIKHCAMLFDAMPEWNCEGIVDFDACIKIFMPCPCATLELSYSTIIKYRYKLHMMRILMYTHDRLLPLYRVAFCALILCQTV